MFQLTNTSPDFWIQLKGENAGQPLRQQIPNAIGIKVNRELMVPDFLFYTVLYLFQTKAFQPKLRGSVIPYIRTVDIRMVLTDHFIKVSLNHQASQMPIQIRRAAV